MTNSPHDSIHSHTIQKGHLWIIHILKKHESVCHSMLTTFKIADHKVVKLAECVDVPKIMIIYGQNGVGKSTLLHALKTSLEENDGKNNIIFVGDLARPEYASGTDHSDDPTSPIISFLSRLEKVRRNIIATSSSLRDNATASHVYEPLDRLLSELLPHLKFERVDKGDNLVPRSVFSRVHNSDAGTEVGLDQLTSAEVDVMCLFLPILDHQIQRKLTGPSEMGSKSNCRDTVVLMDSPSPFLSHDLQSRLLEYLRATVEEDGNIQFIIVTGSPALIDKATAEELFMLMPPDRPVGSVNQLVKASDMNMCLTPI